MDYIGTAIAVTAICALLAKLIYSPSDQRAQHQTIDEASARMSKTNKRK